MNTRTVTNIVLAVTGLAVIVSGFLIWGKFSMAYMKPLHINAGIIMSVACLVHAWTYRKSLVRCMDGGRGLALVMATVVLVGLSPFVFDLGGKGRGHGQQRAEVTEPAQVASLPVQG